MNRILKNRTAGNIISLASILLGLITVGAYHVTYYGFISNGYKAYSPTASILVLSGIVLTILLIFFHREKYVPYLSALLNFAALLFFIHGIYLYVSVMAYGIDAQWNASFFLVSGLFFINFALSTANIFLK